MLSCVVSGFPPQQATVAPSSFAPINKTEVSFVICKQNPKVTPLSGFDFFNREIVLFKIAIWDFAHSYESFPSFTNFGEVFTLLNVKKSSCML